MKGLANIKVNRNARWIKVVNNLQNQQVKKGIACGLMELVNSDILK